MVRRRKQVPTAVGATAWHREVQQSTDSIRIHIQLRLKERSQAGVRGVVSADSSAGRKDKNKARGVNGGHILKQRLRYSRTRV